MSQNCVCVTDRLQRLREYMRKRKIDAWVVLTGDPHLCEYLPEDWAFRKYLSGFTGSAGSLVITLHKALLWTDSRYWEQALQQLEGCGIELMRQGAQDTPKISDWLVKHLPRGSTVGVDARTISMQRYAEVETRLATHDIALIANDTLMNTVWTDRPEAVSHPVFAFDFGQSSRKEKLAMISERLTEVGAHCVFLTALDDVAWVANLRGSDITCTPVFTAYALVCHQGAILYIDPKKFTNPDLLESIKADGFKVVDIKRIGADLLSRLPGHTVLIDPSSTTEALYLKLATDERIEIVRQANPVQLLKSRKTPQELDLLRETMRHDGAALCELFAWLQQSLSDGKTLTETDVADKLYEFRSRLPGFLDLSFGTISAAGSNAALPHYSPSETGSAVINDADVLLIDSGGQYTGGTTDITRTVAVGEVNAELKRDYTAVLRGHIALATAHFPQGTYAAQLDTFARAPIWEIGADYGHGTGHGVGFCLSVHEGPVHISPRCPTTNETRIVKGLVLSNEPGLYRPGLWGIRTENLITPVEVAPLPGQMQPMMTFETLSLCPIDTRLIDTSMMTPFEIWWVNDYHRRVRESLMELLSCEAQAWLNRATEII